MCRWVHQQGTKARAGEQQTGATLHDVKQHLCGNLAQSILEGVSWHMGMALLKRHMWILREEKTHIYKYVCRFDIIVQGLFAMHER